MEKDFGAYLKSIIKKKGLTYRQLALLADIDHGYISQIVNGKAGPPSPKILQKLSRPLGVPYQDLLVAAGYLSEELIKGKTVKIVENPEIVRLPLIGTVAAGTPILAEENIEEYINFPTPLARNATFALRVAGNSMKGVGIQDRDIVFVKQQPDAENGQIVIARVDGEVTCKKLLKTDSKIILLPANDDFEPIESDNVEVVGVVVSATRIFR